jgi:hypothetical protein
VEIEDVTRLKKTEDIQEKHGNMFLDGVFEHSAFWKRCRLQAAV